MLESHTISTMTGAEIPVAPTILKQKKKLSTRIELPDLLLNDSYDIMERASVNHESFCTRPLGAI